jgi:hypothetical protein
MGVVVTAIENKTQWHALRRNVIGASEIAALVGVHEYLTYYGLWAHKAGKLPPDEDNDNGAMERGRRLEPVAVDMLRDRNPTWRVEAPRSHYADHTFGIGCTPDVLAEHPERGLGLIQIKSVAPRIFAGTWRADTDTVTPPIWIVIQALMEQHLTGAKWAAVAALVVDHEIDLHLVEVPSHPGIVENLKTEALRFWEMVLQGRQPDPDFKRDGAIIRELLKKDDGTEIDLAGDNELPALLDQREEVMALAKAYDEQAKALSARLLHRLGNASLGRFPGGYISAKTINKAAYTVKPSSYRQLRVVRKDVSP